MSSFNLKNIWGFPLIIKNDGRKYLNFNINLDDNLLRSNPN